MPVPGDHEGEGVRQVAVGVEAVLDQEEADTLAVARHAEIDGACAGRHVERVVEQDVDVVDRAVGLDLVEAQRVGEGRDRRLELEREAHRAVADQERLVGDAIDRRRIDAHPFVQAGQEVDVAQRGMGVGPAAARRQDEGAVAGEAAVELDGRSAGADRGLGRRDGDAVPAEPHAQHVDGAEAEVAHHVAVEVGHAVAQGRVAAGRNGSCRRRRRRSPMSLPPLVTMMSVPAPAMSTLSRSLPISVSLPMPVVRLAMAERRSP